MRACFSPDFSLGILGGGQLGKMLIQPAQTWNMSTRVLDPASKAPARNLCTEFFLGSLTERKTVLEFGRDADMLTIEIENVCADALLELEADGIPVHPNPGKLKIIQDKGLQKQFFERHGLPTSRFELLDGRDRVLEALRDGRWKIPFVQKLRTGGYDGRGVSVIRTEEDLVKLLDAPCLVEEMIAVEKELSVIAARNPSGEMTCFPPVELEFHPEANLVERLLCPADLPPAIETEACRIAEGTIEAFDLCGLLAVEMFLEKNGAIVINEVAPRPHNSGHHTIESCYTSQYEQHLRAILDLPLGSTALKACAVMVNLLGEDGFRGPPVYEGIEKCLALEGSHIHIYGKKETRGFRKMGHVTLISETLESAREKAAFIKENLRVIA